MQQKPAELQSFSSTEGGFSILLPGTPKYDATTVDSAVGPLVIHSYMVEDAGMAYGVIYTDYPDFVRDADPEDILDGGRDGAVAKIKGTLVSEDRITLGGYPGRDITITSGQMGVRTKICLADTRMYSAIVTGSADKISDPRIEEVLDSFQLTG
jgi:hypothetical protein